MERASIRGTGIVTIKKTGEPVATARYELVVVHGTPRQMGVTGARIELDESLARPLRIARTVLTLESQGGRKLDCCVTSPSIDGG